MERADQNPLLTKNRAVGELFPGREVILTRPPRDRSVNEDIEERGAHMGHGGESEGSWYRRHKGYSEKIQ
jgi:hypothetical protein